MHWPLPELAALTLRDGGPRLVSPAPMLPTICWWGHATVSIVDSGVQILTDPVLTSRIGPLLRRRGASLGPAARTADVVLISHLHADHLHLRSLRQLPAHIPIVLPAGARAAVPALRQLDAAVNLIEISAGESVQFGAVRVRAVPARHDNRRNPLARRHSADALGYVVEGAARTYFAGDTDRYPGMASWIGRCDVALLPVGGWGPGLGPGHLTPSTAARTAHDIGAIHATPIHFGTFWPIGLKHLRPHEFLQPGIDFAEALARLGPGTAAHVLAPGQSFRPTA